MTEPRESIVQILANTTGIVPRISLREVAGDPSPVRLHDGTHLPEIPARIGRYRVTLHFAEIHFASDGRRVFDIECEGKPIASGFDINQAAGFATAHHLPPIEIPLEDGILDLEFKDAIENPQISAIEIEQEP